MAISVKREILIPVVLCILLVSFYADMDPGEYRWLRGWKQYLQSLLEEAQKTCTKLKDEEDPLYNT